MFKLLFHYVALSDQSDMYAFYRIMAHADESVYYSQELERILSDPLRRKRFIDDCQKDAFCASSDIYQHHYSIYQSLPDENKTAIKHAISKQDWDKMNSEAESCGFFASIRKLFSYG
jgi:hypothetical protein